MSKQPPPAPTSVRVNKECILLALFRTSADAFDLLFGALEQALLMPEIS